MAFIMSDVLKNYLCNTGVVTTMAGSTGTAGTAQLCVYSGTQPASPNTGTAGTISTSGELLCVISGIGWNVATTGTAGFATAGGYAGTAITSGTAGWARLETVNDSGTCRIDGDVGTSGTNVFTINVSDIIADGVITLVSADITMA